MSELKRKIVQSHTLQYYRGNLIDKPVSMTKRMIERLKFANKKRTKIWKSIDLTQEQKCEIDKLYKNNYHSRIPYTWHRHYTAYTGNFCPDYFPELLYIPEFERYMNLWAEYSYVFADKNVLPVIAKSVGIKMPTTVISCTKGYFRNSDGNHIESDAIEEILNQSGRVFCKPSVDSCSGAGCFVAEFRGGVLICFPERLREWNCLH